MSIPGSGTDQFGGLTNEIRDIAVDALGNQYVVDTGNNRVQKFGDSVEISLPSVTATYNQALTLPVSLSAAGVTSAELEVQILQGSGLDQFDSKAFQFGYRQGADTSFYLRGQGSELGLQHIQEHHLPAVEFTSCFAPRFTPRFAFFEVLKDFVEAVLANRTPIVRFSEMLHVQQMMEGIYRSAETGNEVRIASPSSGTPALKQP